MFLHYWGKVKAKLAMTFLFGGATLVALGMQFLIMIVRLKSHLHCHVEAKPKHLMILATQDSSA